MKPALVSNSYDRQNIEKKLLQLPSVFDVIFILTVFALGAFIWILSKRSLYVINSKNILDFEIPNFGLTYQLLSSITNYVESVSVLMIIALAMISYFLMWRKYFSSYDPKPMPDQYLEVNKICRKLSKKIGITKHPRIVWAYSKAHNPWVFWFFGHYLVVPQGFLERFNKDSPELSAVLFHELAHIKNNDVIKTTIVQVFSIGYLFTAALITTLRILTSLSIIQIGGSEIITEITRTWPLLMSSVILVYLNLVILRQRELNADRFAAFCQQETLPLRSALVKSTASFAPTPPFAFGAPFHKSTFLERIFRYHPDVKERNLYLFDHRMALSPSMGLAIASGFVTTLAIETGLRAIDISPTGEGLKPLISVGLGQIIGLLILASLLFPALLDHYHEQKKIAVVTIIITTLIIIFCWNLGALLGSLSSILPLDPSFLLVQSIWAFVSSYIGESPRDLLVSVFFASLILLFVTRSNLWNKFPPSLRYFYLPCALGVIPVLIWYSFYAYNVTEINLGGIGARAAQKAIGCILIYLSFLLILISRSLHGKLGISFSLIPKSDFSGMLRFPYKLLNICLSWRFLLLFFLLWIIGFNFVMQLRLEDVTRKHFILESLSIPISTESPAGFKRYIDSELRASIIYPENWTIENADYSGEITRVFRDPSTIRSFSIKSYPIDASLTVIERLNMYNLILFGSTRSDKFLLDNSSPFSIQTKVGEANGYKAEYTAPSGRIAQTIIISLKPLFTGAAYEFTMVSTPEEISESRILFNKIVDSFDIVANEPVINSPVSDNNLYQDRKASFEFIFPFSWSVDEILTSEGNNINKPILLLPEDKPDYWEQISLIPIEESRNSIVVSYIRTDENSNSSDRINKWIELKSRNNPDLIDFNLLDRTSGRINEFPSSRIDFIATYSDGMKFSGAITAIDNGEGYWDVFLFCEEQERSECDPVYTQILNSLKKIKMNTESAK